MDRDAQPSSPWRAEDDADSLVASGGTGRWPSSLDAARGRVALREIRQTLEAAEPPRPREARSSLRQREIRRTG